MNVTAGTEAISCPGQHDGPHRFIVTQRFKQVIGTFKAKYSYLPGDMPNAESFWGSDSTCPNTASNTIPKTATCNGTGDGMIGNWNYITGTIGGSAYESFRAWQQLANANLIPGGYTGVTGPAGNFNPVPGLNSPKPGYRGTSYSLFWLYNPNGAVASGTYAHAPDHVIVFGAVTAAAGSAGPFLTSAEAMQIDGKIDDGHPGLGNIQGPASAPNCTTGSDPNSAIYNSATTNQSCWLYFHLGF